MICVLLAAVTLCLWVNFNRRQRKYHCSRFFFRADHVCCRFFSRDLNFLTLILNYNLNPTVRSKSAAAKTRSAIFYCPPQDKTRQDKTRRDPPKLRNNAHTSPITNVTNGFNEPTKSLPLSVTPGLNKKTKTNGPSPRRIDS